MLLDVIMSTQHPNEDHNKVKRGSGPHGYLKMENSICVVVVVVNKQPTVYSWGKC